VHAAGTGELTALHASGIRAPRHERNHRRRIRTVESPAPKEGAPRINRWLPRAARLVRPYPTRARRILGGGDGRVVRLLVEVGVRVEDDTVGAGEEPRPRRSVVEDVSWPRPIVLISWEESRPISQ
jgi:hypothetical protein